MLSTEGEEPGLVRKKENKFPSNMNMPSKGKEVGMMMVTSQSTRRHAYLTLWPKQTGSA